MTEIKQEIPMLATVGCAGVKRYGGQIVDEFLSDLQGAKGYKAYRQMSDNDASIGAALRDINLLMRAATWTAIPRKGGDTPEHHRWADFTNECLHDMTSTWSDVLSTIASMCVYGWSTPWVTHKIRRGDHESALFQSAYNDGLIGWGDWAPRSQETLYEWVYGNDDQVLGWKQQTPPHYRIVELPLWHMLHFKIENNRGNPEGRSMLRVPYVDWYYKTRLVEIRAIGLERDLAGLPVAYVPPAILNPNADTAHRAVRAEIEDMVSKVRRDRLEGVVFPGDEDGQGRKTGFRFELMSSGGRDFNAINEAIANHNYGMLMSLGAEFMALGQQRVGSFSMHSDKTELFAQGVMAIMDTMCEVINRKAIPDLMIANGVPREYWPELTHGDVEQEGSAAVIDSMIKAINAGIVVPTDADEQHARDLLDWPQRNPTDNPLPSRDGLLSAPMPMPQPDQAVAPVEPEAKAEEPISMDVDEAAQYLKTSRNTIMRAIRNGRLPGAKIGATYRIMREHLDSFMRGGF